MQDRVRIIDGQKVYVDEEGNPLNPFWRHNTKGKPKNPNDSLIERFCRWLERFQNVRQSMKLTHENPKFGKQRLDAMYAEVRMGRAEFVREYPVDDPSEYRDIMGSQEAVGAPDIEMISLWVYDDDYRFQNKFVIFRRRRRR